MSSVETLVDLLSDSHRAFLTDLTRSARHSLARRLLAREEAQAHYDAGTMPGRLPETRAIRDGDWTCGPLPADLLDRRVEITGPVDRKMVINALNSGANVFMADFEDATSPTWRNIMDGQQNLYDAVRTHDHLQAPSQRQALRADEPPRHPDGPPPRPSLGGAPLRSRPRTDPGLAVRLWHLPVPQRRGADRARHGPLLLPAQAAVLGRSAVVERRIRTVSVVAWSPAGHHQGHGAHRGPFPPRCRWRRSSGRCATTQRA